VHYNTALISDKINHQMILQKKGTQSN